MLLEKSGEIALEGMKKLSQSSNNAQSGGESKVRCCNEQHRKGTGNVRSVCAVLCLVAQSWPILCDRMDCSPPGFSAHGDSPGNTGVGCHPSSRSSSQPRDQTQVSHIAGGFFTISKTPGKPINQNKLEVVKQEMARINTDILEISELKWMGMGKFHSDDHYIYHCGQ